MNTTLYSAVNCQRKELFSKMDKQIREEKLRKPNTPLAFFAGKRRELMYWSAKISTTTISEMIGMVEKRLAQLESRNFKFRKGRLSYVKLGGSILQVKALLAELKKL
jgi:hypothetical protein